MAKRLGAATVVGAGRAPDRLAALTSAGADALVAPTDDDKATAPALGAAEVDIVIDYLWGGPTERAIMALLTARAVAP